MNPYSNLPRHHFWRRAVSTANRHEFDPVTSVKFTVSVKDRIATAGSCFAQHISRTLDRFGLHYFVTESGEDLTEAERVARNYLVFSARFGNIYTTRQLIQLFDEAFGRRTPSEHVWRRPDGRLVDPYRPVIEPDGFVDVDTLRASRTEHLVCVRKMFEQADILVFTLGLTEAWLSREDGSVFPLAPGVSGGDYDERHYSFVNLGVAEVEADMRRFLDELKVINPGVKVLLTVSPVPLIATYEDRNVLVATTYSKSVLRVAADTISRAYPWVDYFPSFEIITGSYNYGMYYGDDAREVNHLGVAHAMRVFINNYVPDRRRMPAADLDAAPGPIAAPRPRSSAICDEEAISFTNI